MTRGKVARSIAFTDPEERKLAEYIQNETGLDTTALVRFVFRRYGLEFMAWWNNRTVEVPPQLSSKVKAGNDGDAEVEEPPQAAPELEQPLDSGDHAPSMSWLMKDMDKGLG